MLGCPPLLIGDDRDPRPIGPEGRIILRVAADKVNTPAKVFARRR